MTPRSPPKLVELTPELRAIQARWRQLGEGQDGRKAQDELYLKEFLEPFARLFSELPLHGAPERMAATKPRALVSVLGFSWQPVVLMAAWAHPDTMLVIGTDESLRQTVNGEDVLSLIARIAQVPPPRLERVSAGERGESEIYRAVRDFLKRCRLASREVYVDPTGGKKSMSASAALAGFLAGAPLVYVDYAEYHGPNRIPVAGTEYPRLVENPLDVFGDVELRAVFDAFNRSDFAEAKRLAEHLAGRLYEPREAECLAKLAEAYGAWDRFDFQAARDALVAARALLERFSPQGGWSWAGRLGPNLEANARALEALSQIQEKPDSLLAGLPLLAWYVAAALRLIRAGKPSLAVLLAYAAVERYVDLCLWVSYRMDDETPDYASLGAHLDLAKYHEIGRKLHGNGYEDREPSGPLTLAKGIQLLAALAPERISPADFKHLKNLMECRNKCEYEHGFLPETPKPDRAKYLLDGAARIIARICADPKEFEQTVADYKFPVFPEKTEDVT